MKNLKRLILLLGLLCAGNILMFAIDAGEKPDMSECLSKIKGADMTFYELYRDYILVDKDKAMQYVEQFLERIDSTEKAICLADLYVEVSKYWEMDKFKYSTAIRYREKALSIYKEKNDEPDAYLCYYDLARLYLKKSLYHKTLEYATMATHYFEKTDNAAAYTECYKLLGVVYEKCRDYEKSDEFFQKYAKSARVTNDSLKLFIGLNNTAAFASSIGDNDKAIKLLLEAISLSERIRDTSWICKLYINAAAAYTAAENFAEAEYYLEKAEPLLNNIEIHGHYWVQTGLLKLNQKMGGKNISAASAAFKNAVQYYSMGEFEQNLIQVYSILNDIYRDLGDTVSAYKYLQTAHDLERNMSVEDVMLQLFKEKNELELRTESEIYEAYRKNSDMTVFIVVLLAIIIVVVILLVYTRKSLDVKQKNLRLERELEMSEFKKNYLYRTEMIIRNAVNKLTELTKDTKSVHLKSSINAICEELKSSKDTSVLGEMEQYIPEFNSTFYKNLIKAHPNLTQNESRLCIFINKNLSSKQISEITRQSPDSINVARSRLRKKLGLSGEDTGLNEYLKKFNG